MDASANNNLLNKARYPLGEQCSKFFLKFLLQFANSNNNLKYVIAAKDMKDNDRYSLPVNFQDLTNYDEKLSANIANHYLRLLPYLNNAVRKFIDEVIEDDEVPDSEYTFYFTDYPVITKLRKLKTENKGKLIKIRGQVIRSHAVHPELVTGTFKCKDCGAIIKNVEQEFVYTMPTICTNVRCFNRKTFELSNIESKFVDFQKLHVQEVQDEIPRGNVPRSMEIILRSDKVETVNPGDICEFIGTLVTIPDISQLAMPGSRTVEYKAHQNALGYETGLKGLQALGVRQMTYRLGFLCCHTKNINNPYLEIDEINNQEGQMTAEFIQKTMSHEEIEKLIHMSQDQNLMRNICDSMFPTIYGNEEIKKGIILMLLGGVPKVTVEGTKLRGDINVCIIGDPSTGKSQFLKRIQKFSSRAVYTSGKASTAAGLTAAVVRDATSGDFVIEAGALMLANNGICCIDEFDKMDIKDQVAIHEAMEQQTISLTKAGVKATLSAKCSVLAAANPIFGRYDRSRSLRQNVTLTPPLMSRFDLFFVLLDECDEKADYDIATRILENTKNDIKKAKKKYYTEEELQKYFAFAHCSEPKISMEAAEALEREYKMLRQKEAGKCGFGATSAWRITVRQLESLVRLSEAQAKLTLSDVVKVEHVEESVRLLSKSIVRVIQPDVELTAENATQPTQSDVAPSQPTADSSQQPASTQEPDKTASSLSVTYEQYQSICYALINKLRMLEQTQSESQEQGETPAQETPAAAVTQMRRSELTEWYFESIIDQISDEEDYMNKKVMIEKIIERMIKKDNLLIEISRMELGGEETEDPYLTLHPNVPID